MSGTGGPISGFTYMLPPMTRTADAEALEAWLADANGPARVLVAEGRVEPKMALGWILAQQWAKAKLVAIVTEAGEGGERRWIAERLAFDMPGQRGAPVSGVSREPLAPDDTPVSDHIFRAIKRAANFGHPAPSLKQLADGAGLSSAAGADYYVREKLVKTGKLRIETKAIIGGKRRRYQILDRQGVTVRQTEWGV